MWRQSIARAVSVAGTTRDSIYWIEPKSAHTTIVGHLMKAGIFDGGDVRWNATHRLATTSELLRLGAKSQAVVDELSAAPAYEWTVVREPLSHFVAGFDEVEYYCMRSLGQTHKQS